MKLYTNIFTTIIVTIGSLFGLVPQDRINQAIIPLQSQVSQLEEKLDKGDVILGTYNVTGGGTYRLKSSAGLSDSTINLSSFKEPVSNIPYTMTYLNTDIGYGTLEPQVPDRSEFISFTGITQNSDGSAQLTGVVRGINRSPQGNACTASTTLSVRHPAQSVFLYTSDSPCHFAQYAVKQNNENITGAWTTITPTSASGIATKDYVDQNVNGGAVTIDGVSVAGTAGETVSAGQILYFRQADSRWYKASTAIAEVTQSVLGIAQGSGTAGVAISGGVLISGLDTNQTAITSGVNYFVGSTAGTISTATSSRAIGRAKSTTELYFNMAYIPESPPIGTIVTYASSTTIPAGWLLANGSAISRTTYSELFSVIGTKYGIGDGSTTFNLPNAQHLSKGASNGVDYTSTFNSTGSTQDTWQHTCDDCSLLVVGSNSNTISAASYNGDSMTLVSTGAAGRKVAYLVNPDSGTYNIVVDHTNGGANHSAVSYHGVASFATSTIKSGTFSTTTISLGPTHKDKFIVGGMLASNDFQSFPFMTTGAVRVQRPDSTGNLTTFLGDLFPGNATTTLGGVTSGAGDAFLIGFNKVASSTISIIKY